MPQPPASVSSPVPPSGSWQQAGPRTPACEGKVVTIPQEDADATSLHVPDFGAGVSSTGSQRC